MPFSNEIKGKQGEIAVSYKLNPLIFGKVNHRLINNLVLTDERGKTHQIDHIEIRENGIFCIETKNYSGWIFGSENQDKWTQSFFTGEKHQFINPIKQNRSHIYHLNRVLNYKYKINSIIVLVKNNADKIDIPYVINLRDLSSYLKYFSDGTNLTDQEMNDIEKLLLNSNTKINNREHVKNIIITKQELKDDICPRCGGKLIEKNGRYGKFKGCSNYPKCRFILKK